MQARPSSWSVYPFLILVPFFCLWIYRKGVIRELKLPEFYPIQRSNRFFALSFSSDKDTNLEGMVCLLFYAQPPRLRG